MNVIHLISNRVWGGGERYALDLCRHLRADGHSVAVLCRRVPEVARRFADAGMPVGFLPMRGAIDPLSPILLARVLRRMADPVVVHVHNFKDAALAVRARRLLSEPSKVRIVCTRHLVKAAKRGRSSSALYRRLDAIVFVSELARREFLSSAPAVEPSRLHVIHNSVEAPAAPSEASASTAGGPLRLIFTGRLVAEKGIEQLLRAMAALSDLDLQLTVCGSGDSRYEAGLRNLASLLGIDSRVEWAGQVDDIFSHLRRADIGVAPSVWREPFGLTIIEAMSQGLPVVSTSNGAQSEILSDGVEGLLVGPGDVDALAAAIRRLATDSDMRMRMGARARDTFNKRFAYGRFYDRMLAIYRGDK